MSFKQLLNNCLQERQDPVNIHAICNQTPAQKKQWNRFIYRGYRTKQHASENTYRILTRHRRQNRLSNESRAASRSLSRKELSFFEKSWLSVFLEHPMDSSSFIRASYLACIRCLMVFHISVKSAQRKWETAGPNLTLTSFYYIINWTEKHSRLAKKWSCEIEKGKLHTLTSAGLLEKYCANDSSTGSETPASFIVMLVFYNRIIRE